MSEKKQTIFIIADRDISIVQGSTEMFYLSKFFGGNYNTHVFAPTTQQIPNVQMHSLPFTGIIGTFLMNILYLPYWIYIGATYRPDIVHCYQNVIIPQLILKFLFNSTIIYDIQSDPAGQAQEFHALDNKKDGKMLLFNLSRFLHEFTLSRSDLVITLSDELKLVLSDKYNVSESSIFLLPLGVDTEKFTPKYNIDKNVRFVYIGTINPRRSIDTFFEGLDRIPEKHKDSLSVHLYGSGDREFIRELVNQYRDSGISVKWHGRIPHNEMPNELVKGDIAVSPLPQIESYRVSSPAKLYEYLAAGLPILASDIPPHQKILRGENCGFLVEPTPQGFSEGVTEIMEKKDQIPDLGKRSRLLSHNHDWELRFSKLEKRIEEIS